MNEPVGESRSDKPRRPADFRAPGPRPKGDAGDPELSVQADEDLSYLAGDWRIFQPKRGHRWSLDDLLTAWVAANRVTNVENAHWVDLGCGLGSVLLLLAWAFPDAELSGIEAQKSRADRARRSIRYNGAANRCTVVDGDLREISSRLRSSLPEAPTLVTGTPPYFDPNSTRAAEDEEAAACRIETRGGLEVYLEAANHLVAPEGALVLCYPASEGNRAEQAGRTCGFWLVERLTVVPRADKAPLIVVDVFERAERPVKRHFITVRSADGKWSDEFRAVRRRFGMPDRGASLTENEFGRSDRADAFE